jgi:hypothetical protein
MDTTNRNRSGISKASDLTPDTVIEGADPEDSLARLVEEIEELVEVDPATAAEKAVDIADRLGRQLEEDER